MQGVQPQGTTIDIEANKHAREECRGRSETGRGIVDIAARVIWRYMVYCIPNPNSGVLGTLIYAIALR